MKRLTLKDGDPCDILHCIRFNCNPKNKNELCFTRKMYDKLRTYENKEEHARNNKGGQQ